MENDTTTQAAEAETTQVVPEKPERKSYKNSKSAIVGGFWRRDSSINPGQKYLSGSIVFKSSDAPDAVRASLRLTASPVKTKKSETSQDITMTAYKDDLVSFYKQMKAVLEKMNVTLPEESAEQELL